MTKRFLLAAVSAVAMAFAVPALAASLTLGVGGAQSQTNGASLTASRSASGAALAGIAAGQTTGNANTVGASGAFAQTTPGGMNTGAVHGSNSNSSTNTVSGALGLAATVNASGAGAGSTGFGNAAGVFGTVILSPLP